MNKGGGFTNAVYEAAGLAITPAYSFRFRCDLRPTVLNLALLAGSQLLQRMLEYSIEITQVEEKCEVLDFSGRFCPK